MHACSVTESCLTICDPTSCSPSVSSVLEISQVRILEWVAISYSRGSSQPASPVPPASAGKFFTTEPPGKPPGVMNLGKCGPCGD